jgi:exoribonuclease R
VVTRRVFAPHIDFSALRRELDLPERFPSAAQAEAESAAATPPSLPATDLTGIPFVTIDPPSSMDLDQAMCLSGREGGGFRVRYAIADVAAYVPAGGPLAAETWRRGQTVYLPDGKVPLHPVVLSEGAVSLLPDQMRSAVVWTIDLDADGAVGATRVCRAAVRSRAKLTYAGVQADVDGARLPEPISLLPEIGRLLIERGLARGAIDLPLPAQEVEPVDSGGWRLVLQAPLPVEQYNAQISLLTGMVAAQIMLTGRVGLLRTMPPAPAGAVDRLRASAAPLGIAWPPGATPGRVVSSVDPADPRGAAFLDSAAELMRGAGYTAFDGDPPQQPGQAAVAAPYAHVTAPLRRLADRYATEACLALAAGGPVPEWVRSALPELPAVMAGSERRASAANRGAVDLTEAVLLESRVGDEFDAAVLDVEENDRGSRRPPRALIAIDDPPVRARCEGDGLVPGTRAPVILTVADPATRRVVFHKA